MKKLIKFFRPAMLICQYGEEMLLKDPLTRVYNRVLLNELGRREIKRAERYGNSLCCVMVDIDNLKVINDTKSHSAGDLAIKTVADALCQNCRNTDLIFRYGGDEFVALLTEIPSMQEVEELFKRIAKKLSKSSLSVSMGACFWEKGINLDELIKKADVELYACKNSKK